MRSRCAVCPVLILALLLIASTVGAQVTQYTVTSITSPYNQLGLNIGHGINRGGAIALTDFRSGPRGFVWTSGKSVPLPLLGGACSTANGINNSGHIVGGACLPGQTLMHAYFFRNGNTFDLGTLGGVSAQATQLNGYDHIAGNYALADGTARGFFGRGNKWVDLGNLGGSFTVSLGMNSFDIVTGQSDITNTPDPIYNLPHFHGFVWSRGTLRDVGSIFGSDFNFLAGINDAGVAVGSADLAGDTGAHAIVWNHGTVRDLSPSGNISAYAIDINNVGQVVGTWGSVDPDPADGPPVNSVLCPCFAVLWQNGQEVFLNDTVPPGWDLWIGLAINDMGQIVARGQYNGGPLSTVLLTPMTLAAPTQAPDATPPMVRQVVHTRPHALRRDPKVGFQEIW